MGVEIEKIMKLAKRNIELNQRSVHAVSKIIGLLPNRQVGSAVLVPGTMAVPRHCNSMKVKGTNQCHCQCLSPLALKKGGLFITPLVRVVPDEEVRDEK